MPGRRGRNRSSVFPPGTSQDHPVIFSSVDQGGRRQLYVFASSTFRRLQGITLSTSGTNDLSFRSSIDYTPDSLNNNLGSGVVVQGTPVFTYYNMTPPERRLWAVRLEDGQPSRHLIAADVLPVAWVACAAT